MAEIAKRVAPAATLRLARIVVGTWPVAVGAVLLTAASIGNVAARRRCEGSRRTGAALEGHP